MDAHTEDRQGQHRRPDPAERSPWLAKGPLLALSGGIVVVATVAVGYGSIAIGPAPPNTAVLTGPIRGDSSVTTTPPAATPPTVTVTAPAQPPNTVQVQVGGKTITCQLVDPASSIGPGSYRCPGVR